MTRPSWDQYFIDMAWAASSRSTCPRLAVGAVIVKDKTIIGTGYNGAPSTSDHCMDIDCVLDSTGSCTRAIHAEKNAIARSLMAQDNCDMYVTDRPCLSCGHAIVASGIKRIVYSREYRKNLDEVLDLFSKHGIVMEQLVSSTMAVHSAVNRKVVGSSPT